MPEIFVHPAGLCESDTVGGGTRVWAFAHVLKGAQIGRDCNICDGAFVESGAVLGDRVTVKNGVLVWDGVAVGDDVFLGPAVAFTNDLWPRSRRLAPVVPTRVRRGATVGANATIVCGVELGEWCFVAAGSVVTRDIAAYALVVGNPGRRVGWVCRCGQRLDPDLRCACGEAYEAEPATGGLRPSSAGEVGSAQA